MKRTLSGLAALTLFDIASAHAQTPPIFSWTGYYLGGHAGFRYDEVTATGPYGGFPNVTFGFPGTASFPVPAASVRNDSGSGVIGLQGGYNLQFSYNYLVGLEGDFSWGRDHSSVSFVGGDPALGAFSTNTITTTIDWTASLRGKLGYVIGPRLLYATAGVSFMNMNMAGNGGYGHSNIFGGGDFFTTVASSSNYSLTKTLVGPTVGVGIEEMLASKWLVRAEYLFADYGNVNFGNVLIGSTYSDNVTCHCTVVSTTAGTASARVMTQTFRLGLSLKLP